MGLASREERLGAIKSLKPVYPKHVGLPDQLIQLMVAFSILYFTGNSLSLSFQASGQLRTPAGLGPDNRAIWWTEKVRNKGAIKHCPKQKSDRHSRWCASASTRIGKVPWNLNRVSILSHTRECRHHLADLPTFINVPSFPAFRSSWSWSIILLMLDGSKQT